MRRLFLPSDAKGEREGSQILPTFPNPEIEKKGNESYVRLNKKNEEKEYRFCDLEWKGLFLPFFLALLNQPT